MSKLLSLSIVLGLVFESNQQLLPYATEPCWTGWFDRDDPSGTGDWETLEHLRKSYPRKICPSPIGIQAQTLSASSPTVDVIFKEDTTEGFVCRNEDQPPGKMCQDYRVRFRCPPIFCQKECWTNWFDRDDPTGSGDWETLFHLHLKYPGKICPIPIEIEATTLSGSSPAVTGDAILVENPVIGFICRNSDQTKNKMCSDYRVRFRCPPKYCQKECWTKWYDRDHPSGSGDWELLSTLREENPGQICAVPLHIEVVTTDTLTAADSTGQHLIISPLLGCICLNHHQKTGICRNYKVRFECPC
ncbi:hypothetical protein JOB18_029127 [Solea senegalensis]|uniref:WxxW domain-containing protein n=1 Tax=Solea senegalensis TaxID=28829 RepID=A0AAV6RW81_SOLSE|nr:cartilage intermediate layer protein 2-like [Solea senegalensis]KAG7508924.1 hypothetical protein JOB18_029127 [Solea senegalensis]KAG7508925.1 hypothetical protein JOB18_029127 [Solea senegalensis]